MITVYLSPSASKAVCCTKANSYEGVPGHSFLDCLPTRLVGDRAYDSDRLDRNLAERYGIEMIAPHRGVRRTVVPCAVIANIGESSDYSLGSITFVDW